MSMRQENGKEPLELCVRRILGSVPDGALNAVIRFLVPEKSVAESFRTTPETTRDKATAERYAPLYELYRMRDDVRNNRAMIEECLYRVMYEGRGQLFHFGKGNIKIAPGALTWSLPSTWTCPGAGICKEPCYSKKRERNFTDTRISRARNYLFSLQEYFVPEAVGYLSRKKESLVRVNDDGDFYSLRYLEDWKEIARRCPEKTFMAYTKSFHLPLYEDLPRNFIIIQSYGSRFDERIDPNNNTARVDWGDGRTEDHEYRCTYGSENALRCGTECTYCWDVDEAGKGSIHVVFHRH